MEARTFADVASIVARAAASASTTAAANTKEGRPATYKAVGISLAVASGFFIGVSFVLKKKGLLAATNKSGKEAGEGYDYLKNAWWWTGMSLMIIGEICNFCAYAFVEAILVTPLGALSVVITAILSSIFLKERLSFVGKIGCFMCIVGSVIIVMNAPEQASVSTIQDMKYYVISPGFLSYAGVIIAGCIFVAWWVAPRYGTKSMMVYLTICSLIGGLSVVATQGLGAAVVTQIGGTPQFNQWFLYVLLVFVIVTLLTEIIYLNKALNIFNAALVTPTYYVFFTSSTIVTSAVLFRGFKGTPTSITTVVMGFLNICSGVVLLQLSKSAKDVPDTEVFRGDFDQVRIVAEQSEPESEPKADTIRGAAAIIRRISVARRQAEEEEARRVREERLLDLNGGGDDKSIQWDGVRRRTVTWGPEEGTRRRNTLAAHHPPPNLTRIPDIEEAEGVEDTPAARHHARRRSMSVDEAMRQQVYPNMEVLPTIDEPHPEGFYGRIKSFFVPKTRSIASLRGSQDLTPHRDVRDASSPLDSAARSRGYTVSHQNPYQKPPDIRIDNYRPYSSPSVHSPRTPQELRHVEFAKSTIMSPHTPGKSVSGSSEYSMLPVAGASRPSSASPVYTSAPPPPPTPEVSGSSGSGGAAATVGSRPQSPLRPDSRGSGKRQFSFQSILHPRHHHHHGHIRNKSSGSGTFSFGGDGTGLRRPRSSGGQTEEERLGLVKGDDVEDSSSSLDEDEDEEKGAGVRVEISESPKSLSDEEPTEQWIDKDWEGRGGVEKKPRR